MSFSVIASGALVFGRSELLPGAEVAVSVMLPIPTEWWLRPVSSAWRVGAHSAVVWKRLYRSPPAASRSAVGVWHGPPNALDAPKPDVVEQDDQHVRRALGRQQRLDRRERRVRVLGVVRRQARRRAVRDRQHRAGVAVGAHGFLPQGAPSPTPSEPRSVRRGAASPGTGEQVTQRVVEDHDVTAIHVNADNFARAETHRMMAGLQRDAGGVNHVPHNREPAAVDKQTVIRMNRDTLYSFAVVDISAGATLTCRMPGSATCR